MTGEYQQPMREIQNGTREGIFHFHPDDAIYRDHFPGYPVVPGSLIIHAFMKAAEEYGFSGDHLTIENFRFREFLTPGHYPFRVELQKDRMNCFIYRNDRKLVTGVLKR
jgi:3-hydroxyacyl-[acyl-carrier-protein] dehydratase